MISENPMLQALLSFEWSSFCTFSFFMKIEDCFFPCSHEINDSLRFIQHADSLHKIMVLLLKFTNSLQKNVTRPMSVCSRHLFFLLGLMSWVAVLEKINTWKSDVMVMDMLSVEYVNSAFVKLLLVLLFGGKLAPDLVVLCMQKSPGCI